MSDAVFLLFQKQILPNVAPEVVVDARWPGLQSVEWHWKNVTEEEARGANMAFPQIYRDGHGSVAGDLLLDYLSDGRCMRDYLSDSRTLYKGRYMIRYAI